jgi:two-component system response regulator
MIKDPPTVLLVEDNPDDEELTIRAFERANLKNPVDVARDGHEALDYLFGTEEQPPKRVPAVVVLDLNLPEMDGLEVLKRIRAEERTRRVPVVILTSSSEDRDVIAGYDLGANSYVRKPIQFDQFATTVAQLGVYWLMINEPAPTADHDTEQYKGDDKSPQAGADS